MLLAENKHLLIEQAPVARIFAYCHDGYQKARGGGKVGGLPCLLLKCRELLNRGLYLAGLKGHDQQCSAICVRNDMAYLCMLLCFRDRLVDFLGEVLVRLQDRAVGHGGGVGFESVSEDAVVVTRS